MGNCVTEVHIPFLEEWVEEMNKIMEEGTKMESMGGLCIRLWQVAGVSFLQCDFFSVVCPKPAPLRRWWIQQCVCLEAAVLPLLAKNFTFGF